MTLLDLYKEIDNDTPLAKQIGAFKVLIFDLEQPENPGAEIMTDMYVERPEHFLLGKEMFPQSEMEVINISFLDKAILLTSKEAVNKVMQRQTGGNYGKNN